MPLPTFIPPLKSLFFASCLLVTCTFSSAQTVAHASGSTITLQQGGQLGNAFFADGDTDKGGHGQVIDGIEGSSHEMLKYHYHAHLSIYYKDKQIAVPRGIGIIKPLQIANGFVEGGKGFYWLHTHDASGILHIESPTDKTYDLGNFFDIWGQPLDAHNVAGFHGTVRTFVNGRVYFGDIRKIALIEHLQISLAIDSPAVAPANYVFPDGL
ncbi:hypothetical protein [Glaciimonas sp. PCH181]|uniref:hypothetical protein n=1 Tax=Glaciimonas sp. PCH181 TaxID=2133943 RepID=UPI0011B2456C|nr:hypothetical protein [Glaciimonas sp. PCH181]